MKKIQEEGGGDGGRKGYVDIVVSWCRAGPGGAGYKRCGARCARC